MQTDSRNLIGRKFIERCGFVLEAILIKHQIFEDRNRDTALYVLLNSDWEEKAVKLKKYLGWDTRVRGKKLFDIPNAADEIPILKKSITLQEAGSTAAGKSIKKKKKKNPVNESK